MSKQLMKTKIDKKGFGRYKIEFASAQVDSSKVVVVELHFSDGSVISKEPIDAFRLQILKRLRKLIPMKDGLFSISSLLSQ